MFLNCKTGQFSGTERGFGIPKVPYGQVFSDESTLFEGECVIYMRTSVNKRILNVNMCVNKKMRGGISPVQTILKCRLNIKCLPCFNRIM